MTAPSRGRAGGRHGRWSPARRAELLVRLADLRRSPAVADGALAGARVALAWLFIYHGAGTLFGAFHGAGIHRMAEFFSTTAHLHPGTFFAVLNGITEFFGGIAVGIGLLTRLAAVGLFFDMVVAMITVSFANGVVSGPGGSGYEINVALAGLALVVALLGAGRLSLDAWLGQVVTKRRSAPVPSLPVESP